MGNRNFKGLAFESRHRWMRLVRDLPRDLARDLRHNLRWQLRSQLPNLLGLVTLILVLGLPTLHLPAQSQIPSLLPTPTPTPTATTNPALLSLQNLEQRLNQVVASDNRGLAIARIQLDGYPLFAIAVQAGIDASTTAEALTQRQDSIETTLKRIAQSGFDPQTLSVLVTVDNKSSLPVLTINDQYLMTVTTLDAQLQGGVPERVANEYAATIKQALLRSHHEYQPSTLVQQGLWACATVLVAMLASRLLARYQQRFSPDSPEATTEATVQPTVQSSVQSSVHSSEPSPARTPAQLADLARQHLQQKQQTALKEAKRRSLQLVQVGILGLSLYLLLGMFPYTRWLQPFVVSAPLKVMAIGLSIYVLMRLSDTAIDYLCRVFEDGQPLSWQASMRVDQRISTISQAGKGLSSILLLSGGVLASLAVLGVNLLPLLTGAGIVGLAISFAAQSVIKDVINGFLILFEDQYAVGDVITVGEVGGLVENMNLRITQLRNNEGRLITLPNSAISVVQNLSKDWARVDLTVQVSLQADPNATLAVLRELAQVFYQDPFWQPKLLDRPEILGIDELTHAGMLIRIWIKTRPLEQWTVAREFRRRLQELLRTDAIAIGIPQQTNWLQAPFGLDSISAGVPALETTNEDETQSNHSELKHQNS